MPDLGNRHNHPVVGMTWIIENEGKISYLRPADPNHVASSMV